MKITTADGFVCSVSEDALGDWEMVEKMVDIQKGDVSLLREVMEDLLEGDGYADAKNHVRTEKGRVPTERLISLFFEILTKAREVSEDKKK